VSVEGDWPVVATVPHALDLVLRNLIENAIKHHDRTDGQVIVSATSAGPRTLVVTVRDDGPGIPVAFHDAAFQPFRRLAEGDESGVDHDAVAAIGRHSEGSGIGLALVRKTAEATGATVTLDSDPSRRRGTTFTLHWPITDVAR
jgi:signal transduction histidine kinase